MADYIIRMGHIPILFLFYGFEKVNDKAQSIRENFLYKEKKIGVKIYLQLKRKIDLLILAKIEF